MSGRKRKTSRRSPARRMALGCGVAGTVLLVLWAWAGVWFVHHSRSWLDRRCGSWPRLVTAPLAWIGNPVGDVTDALGLTGHDAVYEYDEPAPSGEALFAGAPVRFAAPAPKDIVVLDRGEFKIGWSPKLRHPVWCAYHVPVEARHEAGKRPNFTKDKSVDSSPAASAYERSGYDRGHMVPNYAIATRFGEEMQRSTFRTTNIAPQSPALNRGPWRDVEHRIADFWTERWGEIWVIVGCISDVHGETLTGTDVDVPRKFYQVVVAEEETGPDRYEVRAFAVVLDQELSRGTWPTRYLVTIDELEEMTGLDFLPELPEFIQRPLESELPSRLWPIRPGDIIRLVANRFL